MKVFWSWQSDTPGRIGRFFVRDALKEAIKDLNEEVELEVPKRPEGEELHLDHDREGVSGSPDLPRVILEKIRESAVFVADVTSVGRTVDDKKPLMNANVAIELGYALAQITDTRILMVMNEAFGGRDTLPFDLRHRGGPVMFNLPADAGKPQIQAAMRSLRGQLKSALRECLKVCRVPSTEEIAPVHVEIQSKTTPAQYFDEGEILATRQIGDTSAAPLRYTSGKLLYLRVIPGVAMDPLREADMAELVFGIKVQPLHFYLGGGACHGRNQYGGCTYSFTTEGGTRLLTSTQLFPNREIWGIDAFLLEHGQLMHAQNHEEMLQQGLHHYIAFGKQYLQYSPPLSIEAGATGVRDMQMIEGGMGRVRGAVTHPEIRSRHRLDALDDKSVDSVLLAIFEDFFDAAGLRRPANYRGFPPKTS